MNFDLLQERIAAVDGVLGAKWGPCFCGDDSQTCAACVHANALEAAGLDYHTEYRKWRASQPGGKHGTAS